MSLSIHYEVTNTVSANYPCSWPALPPSAEPRCFQGSQTCSFWQVFPPTPGPWSRLSLILLEPLLQKPDSTGIPKPPPTTGRGERGWCWHSWKQQPLQRRAVPFLVLGSRVETFPPFLNHQPPLPFSDPLCTSISQEKPKCCPLNA